MVNLEIWVRGNWQCLHSETAFQDGWCGQCGLARDDYTFEVGRGDNLQVGLDGYAFVYRQRILWYRDALYKLGIFTKPQPLIPDLAPR